MEPVALKCAKCDAEWKLFKCSSGPILCPKCHLPVAGTPTVEPMVVLPAPPPDEPPPRPFLEPLQHSLEARDYGEPDGGDPAANHTHPLLNVIMILLLLFVLLPVVLVILFMLLCAMGRWE
jgi:hypothetical protein